VKKALYPIGIVIAVGTLLLILNGRVERLDADQGAPIRPVKTLVVDTDFSLI
jgi:hypothetical protein